MTTVRDTVAGMLGATIDYEAGLDMLTVAPAADVDRTLAAALSDGVAALVRAGWQPAELHRVVARQGDPAQTELLADAIGRHLAGFRDVDPRWRAQAEELRRGTPTRRRADRVAQLDATLRLLGTLRRLPPIEILIPPPGTATPARAATPADQGLLHRVRALLAKAESTDFPAEAEAYSAKAQELIARHSIADALAEHTAEVVPYARRIGVDHPYENEKAGLLDAVARANRCHTVWSPELGFSTVFGFDADIDAVELLYTSLLLQGHRAMAAAEPRGGSKARIKAFRRSFLIAYAVRIGERLDRATAAAVSAGPADLLPVLASRDVQVRETMNRVFPTTVRARGSRVDSHEGRESGRAAADRAEF